MIAETAHVAALIKMGWRDRPFETPATCPPARCQVRTLAREKDESDCALTLRTAHAEGVEIVSTLGRMAML